MQIFADSGYNLTFVYSKLFIFNKSPVSKFFFLTANNNFRNMINFTTDKIHHTSPSLSEFYNKSTEVYKNFSKFYRTITKYKYFFYYKKYSSKLRNKFSKIGSLLKLNRFKKTRTKVNLS